jgi:hypothetical protein
MHMKLLLLALSLAITEAGFGLENSNAGGLKNVFTEVDGKAIAHPNNFPMDGIGRKFT